MDSLVSVIIPTKNSARTIGKCLESIKNQSYSKIEIIVVDNSSTDGTADIARQYTDKVYTQWPERTTQKNHGIAQATGKYLCFIDSDMTLGKLVIKQCIDVLSDSWIGGVCIPEHSVGGTFFARVRDFERSFYEGTAVESARFFRWEQVVEVGGFEEDLIFYEESLLPQKISATLWLDCTARIIEYIDHNESDIRLWSWLKKKYYYGKSLREYQEKIKELWVAQTWAWQMSIIRRYMIFLGNRRFYTQPILAIAVLKLKTLEFLFGWIGLLSSHFH